MTVQSPSSQARTSVSLPTICRFATYSRPRNLLSCSLLGMKTRSCSIVSRVPRILVGELSEFPSGRIGVDVARLDPLVSGPAGVACCPKPAGYALARAQRCHQPQNRQGARERARSSTYTRV